MNCLDFDFSESLLTKCCRQTAYKKHVEYLFWVWDPALTDEQNELMRTLEEGFMSANAYFVTNSVICSSHLLFVFIFVCIRR